MYVGHSIKFGHSVPLVLDLDTGSITAQFHVVFDDWFQGATVTLRYSTYCSVHGSINEMGDSWQWRIPSMPQYCTS